MTYNILNDRVEIGARFMNMNREREKEQNNKRTYQETQNKPIQN